MPDRNGVSVFLIILIVVSAFSILAVKLAKFLKRFNRETEDITMEIHRACDDSECRYWRRKLRCHYLCLIPFVNEQNVMSVYHFFYHRLRPTKEEALNDGLFHILAPSIIGACICAVCLFGATWAWFTVSCSSAVSTLTAATYTVSVNVEAVDTQEEPVMTSPSAQKAPAAAPKEDADPTDGGKAEEPTEEGSDAEQPAMDNAPAAEPEAPAAENAPVEIEEETGSEADKAEEVAPNTTEPTEQTEDEGKKAEMYPAYAPAAAKGKSAATIPEVTSVNGGYQIVLESGKTYNIKITATGTATTGYCTVQIGDDTYYTPQIANSECFAFTVKANETVTLTITPQWGTYSGAATINDNQPLEYGTSAGAKGGNFALSLPKETVDGEKPFEETENGELPTLPEDTDDNGEGKDPITEVPADNNGNDAPPDQTGDVEQPGGAQAEEDTQPTEPEPGEEETA